MIKCVIIFKYLSVKSTKQFKFISLGERLQKTLFLLDKNAVSLWTKGRNEKKKCVFKYIWINVRTASGKADGIFNLTHMKTW